MGVKKFTEDELRYWRIYAALQELCYANDADVDVDATFAKFLDLNARAIFTFQNSKLEKLRNSIRVEVLKEVGIPVIGGKK